MAHSDDPEATQSANPASFAPVGNLVADRTPVRDPRRYEILGEHGRGGLGRVSRAYDKDLGRDIAVKELLSRDHVHEQRFAREALITARLEHPGIVPVYEAGRWPDGTPFYAMKLLAGRSLRELLAERTTVAARIALLHHVIAVADAMAYAHGRNIIHRDLKPANVIVGDFGETVVIDWGLAKDLSDAEDLARGDSARSPDDELTSLGSVIGTPSYMPPEQERGERVDRRADVFAIGAMLWELCSVQKVPPSDPGLRRRMFRVAGIDPDLVVIIEKALAPDPARRYPDAGALAADLKAFQLGARIAARSYSLWAMLAHWTRRHRGLALASLVVLLFAVGSVAVFVRNIARERDRTDAALVVAREERDRSKLAEAALLLNKEPNRAQELLRSFTTPTPQIALLTSRARGSAAVHVVPTSAMVRGVTRAPGAAEIDVVTADGALTRIDELTGARTTLDRDAMRVVGYRDGHPVYLRNRAGELAADHEAIDARPYGATPRLIVLRDASYVLEASGVLHRLQHGRDAIVGRDVVGIGGDARTLLVCRTSGVLEVERDGVTVLRDHCRRRGSFQVMVVVGDDYALIAPDGTLVASRAGQVVRIPTGIRGEHELAIANGAIAISDYGAQGKTWLVRPGEARLEPGSSHVAQPWEVAADGDLVAWGFADGAIDVLDVATGVRHELRGHTAAATYVVLDAARARAVSSNPREQRIWSLATAPSKRVAAIPCSSFHLEPSPDRSQLALDCNDGNVRVWSRATDELRAIQHHEAWSNGLEWLPGQVCAGSWGGAAVTCSRPDGTEPIELSAGPQEIRVMVAARDGSFLFGANDGGVTRVASTAKLLYAHAGPVYQLARSDDGRWLASCAGDDSIAVFDLTARRMEARTSVHVGPYCGVGWRGDELWSAGDDGALRRWSVEPGRLRPTHTVQTRGALSRLNLVGEGWVAVEAGRGVIVSLDGRTVAIRIDAGAPITALDRSPDGRYVAASVETELIVIDTERHAIASAPIGLPVSALRFLEPGLLAFSEPTALQTLDVAKLAYEPFALVPEPANRASF